MSEKQGLHEKKKVKKYDRVKLINQCDSSFLFIGDTGQAFSDVLKDGSVAVGFDKGFSDSHDCEGLVSSYNGWFVNVEDLQVIQENTEENMEAELINLIKENRKLHKDTPYLSDYENGVNQGVNNILDDLEGILSKYFAIPKNED